MEALIVVTQESRPTEAGPAPNYCSRRKGQGKSHTVLHFLARSDMPFLPSSITKNKSWGHPNFRSSRNVSPTTCLAEGRIIETRDLTKDHGSLIYPSFIFNSPGEKKCNKHNIWRHKNIDLNSSPVSKGLGDLGKLLNSLILNFLIS